MGKILISGGLIPTTPNTLVDAREKVSTFAKIADIENPALYMVITVEDTGKKYEVKKLTSKVIGGIVVKNAAIDINDPEALLDLGLAEELRAEDEKVRQENESKRIEAESLRKTAEDSRSSNERSRISAESAREASEKTRANAEEVRNTNEQTRNLNESKRQSQESTRQNQESARQANESTRNANESARKTAESERKTEEASRRTAELAREREESTRSRNEQGRTAAENTRSAAEDRRVANENKRIVDETARNNAELSREQAEGSRASTFNTLKSELETTIQEGQEANVLSEAATQRANEAANTIETWESVVVTTEDDGDVSEVEADVVNEAIRKTPQTLSKTEQAQARTNIGASSLEENNAFKKEVSESNEAFKTEINTKVSEIGSYVSNPEYARAYTDAEGRFLWGIKQDGSIEFAKGVPTPIKKYIVEYVASKFDAISNHLDNTIIPEIEALKETNKQYLKESENPEWIRVIVDADGKVLEGIGNDGKKYFPKQEMFEKYNDPEGRSEMTLDSEGRVISFRDAEGALVEEVGIKSKHIETDKITLSEEGLTDLGAALKKGGVQSGTGNWSDYLSNDGDIPLNLPEPKCAIFNIISNVDLTQLKKAGKSGALEGVNYNIPTKVEFWDMQGNYFAKWTLMSGQGDSSLGFIKKNMSFDFFDSEVDGDAFSIKFGNWVAQDSFHLKAYYTDAFRGIGVVGYKLFMDVYNTHSIDRNRAYKQNTPHIGGYSDGTEKSDMIKVSSNYDESALCFPDGFPVIVYQNGKFWGVFSWQLKKHRDNYHMDKKNNLHIHLDGIIDEVTLFAANGDSSKVDWRTYTDTGFEIRNPKNLTLMDGSEYDADEGGGEISDGDTKQAILRLSTYIPELKQMESDGKTPNEIRERLAEMFDKQFMIDYIVTNGFIGGGDGWRKNWQWITYNGYKWIVCPYDLDGIFGSMHIGTSVSTSTTGVGGKSKELPTGWFWSYYKDEIEDRYKSLRDKGVFSSDNIVGKLNDWIRRIGIENWELEFEKWNESPAYRKSHVNTEYWKFVGSAYQSTADYDNTKSYVVGTQVVFGRNDDKRNNNRFECVKNCIGQKPVTHIYKNYPWIMGHFDSPYRVKSYIDNTIVNADENYNYNINY